MSTADAIALSTSIATWIYVFLMAVYVILVAVTLLLIREQLHTQKETQKFQATLAVFKEIQSQDLTNARRYIYESLPEIIEGIGSNQLKTHLQKIEIAIINLDRIGYLIQQGHIDREIIMETYWPSIWRCWKKSKNLINWIRELRGEKDAFGQFEYLFNLSESYRIQNELPEPKFYQITTFIQTA